MKSKRMGVVKVVALAVVPLSLAVVVANVAERRRAERAEAATKRVRSSMKNSAVELMLSTSELKNLIAEGANVNVRGAHEYTPLHSVLRAGGPQNRILAKILTDNGADVNARDHRGNTPLAVAVHNQDVEAVRLLLSKGANPNLGVIEDGKEYELLPTARLNLRNVPMEYPNLPQIIQLLKAAGAKE